MLKQDLHTKNRTQLEVAGNGAPSFVGQPCLVVGTGGIGHRIVLALKALLVDIFGSVPAGIRLLVFDIDDENLSMRVGNRLVALEREVELFCLGPVPVARIKRNLDNLPTIRDRLPCLRDLPPMAAVWAGKQLRPLGQLAFQWRFPRIHGLIRDAIWTLAGRDQRGDEDLVVDPSRGLKVIQVGSNCGGTNAGMFIDLGCLLRNELEGLGTLGDACTIIGVGMLPGAFRGIIGPNLVPNTVASLMELEWATMDGDLSLTYRDGTVVKPARPPFDMYLLVDAVDEGGRVWISRDDLCRMVARAILVLAATSLGEQQEGELDNLDEVLSQGTPDGHGTFFGSLGLATLEFPAETIVEFFSARHAQAVIAEGLLRPADPRVPEDDAVAWLQAQNLSADALVAELARDKDGLPMAVVVQVPASLRRLPDHQIPQEAIQFVQAYTRLRLDGDYRAWARNNAEALADGAVLKLDVAKPAWNLDETRLYDGDASLRRITVVGVPDHTRSIFKSNGNQLVSTHDPRTVIALSLTVGAPYTALQAWPEYLAEYKRVRRLRPLHTLPAFQMEGQEAGLALALGLIFGQIFTRGAHFYYRPSDELEPEVRLAHGAANAIQSLAAQEGLVREVMDRVEAHIEHIGIGQALERLTTYCAPCAGDDDLTLELKRLVRDYAEMLQANARVAGRRA